MADIFNEIDQDLRQDRLRKVWDRVGVYVIGAAVLVVAGVAGWRGYEYWAQQKAEAAGDRYYSALKLAEAGDAAGASAALSELGREGPAGYTVVSALRSAALTARNDRAEGLKAFDAAARMPSMPPVMASVARIQAGYLAVDLEDLGALTARLKDFIVPGNAFRHAAREILLLGAIKSEDWDRANATIGEMQGDAELPQSIEQRVEMYASLVKAAAPVKSVEAPKAP